MDNDRSFLFDPNEWNSDQEVQRLTSSEEGTYIRMVCFHRGNGYLPIKPEDLLPLCKSDVKEFPPAVFELLQMRGFFEVEDEC